VLTSFDKTDVAGMIDNIFSKFKWYEGKIDQGLYCRRDTGKGYTLIGVDMGVENDLYTKGIELYPEKYELLIDGADVKLTKTEFDLLALFMRYPGKIFSRDNIIDSVRGNDVYVTDRTIDVHIMNIRKKLGKYKNVITTFSGVGYGFKK